MVSRAGETRFCLVQRSPMSRRRAGSPLASGLAAIVALVCVMAKADPAEIPPDGASMNPASDPVAAEVPRPAAPPAAAVPLQADSSSPGAAQPGQPSSSKASETASEVVVKAQREALEHRMQGFVRKITQNPRFSTESLPRWNTPVCFAVAGLPTREGSYVLGRLKEVAGAVGARVGRRGCRYNFYVVFTPQPDKLLQEAFRHPGVFDESQGKPAVRRFLSPSKPQAVRAWHNVIAVGKDGHPVTVNNACFSISVGGTQIPVSCQYFPSRISRYDVMAFSLALVIIDTTFPKVANLGQLTDLAAMVGLADIDADADIADAPSILQLFAGSSDAPPSGLTAWDQAFLSGLYRGDQSVVTQRSQIAVRMFRDASH